MAASEPTGESGIHWQPVTLVGRRVTDVDGALVTMEFDLAVPEDKAWYQCFAQARGPRREGSATFVTTTPQFVTGELLAWKVELGDIAATVHYLIARVEEANRDFVALLERKEQIRRQLEAAALRREEAIAEAQRLLDESWPAPPDDEEPAVVDGEEAAEAGSPAPREATALPRAQPQSGPATRSSYQIFRERTGTA